jgi:hypothetical protein
MKMILFPVVVLAAALVAGSVSTVEAREPFIGQFQGHVTRRIAKAKKKKKKLQAEATTVQTGGPYDAKTVVEADGGGESVTLVLDFQADNGLSININGQTFSGNTNRSVPRALKKLKYKGSAKGTAVFVGPLKQEIKAEGKINSVDTTITGFIDLVGDTLILELNLKSSSKSRLGPKASFSLKADRT